MVRQGSTSQAGGAVPVFAALGDATRLRLLARLCASGPLSIARLTQGSDISRQAITKHLRALEHAGLLRGVRAGREQLWELQPQRLEQARSYLAVISRQWDQALERLRALVETP
jgi:DNA-binding transcriptional ArsR family regulator